MQVRKLTSTRAAPLVGPELQRALGYARFKGDTLTVLVLDGGYHLVQESMRALAHLGHRPIAVPIGREVASTIRTILWALVEHKPDAVLSINHIGFDEQGTLGQLLEHAQIPLAVWYVDSPVYVLRRAELPATHVTTLFLWERALIPQMHARGAEDVHYLPLGTDPQCFTSPSAPSQPKRPVAFVGDSMAHARKKWRARLTSSQRRRARELAGQLSADRSYDLMQRTRNDPAGADVMAAATWEATRCYRSGMLRGLEDELTVYGDEGWRSELPRARFGGSVSYGEALARIYRESTININLTSLQMPSAVNQRVFDVPAAGGFLLTDAQEDVALHFDPGREIITFRTAEQLAELVPYYRSHETERQRLIEHARRRVLSEHTYVHRLAVLVDRLRKRHACTSRAVAMGR